MLWSGRATRRPTEVWVRFQPWPVIISFFVESHAVGGYPDVPAAATRSQAEPRQAPKPACCDAKVTI